MSLSKAKSNPTGGGGGQAIQVINFQTVKDKPSKLSINENSFREVLQTSGDLPVYFLSVAGAARQGKSFLLNVVVLYLAALERGEEDPWKSVLDCKDMSAFSFRTNVERNTVGFWMWPKPFILEKCGGGGKIAVFIVDTQGVFDQQTSPRDCAMIVGLTFLTSSCVIYNLMNNMQEDTLQAMETFVDFSKLSSGESGGKLFQKLLFLIRDWNIPDQFPYGGIGGSQFIKWKLDTQNSEIAPEFRAIREKINSFFQKKECFLMPPPGENVKSLSFRGDISTLEPQFQTHLRAFLENNLNPDGMDPMTLNGDRLMTGADMFHYFDKYVKALNSAKFPKPHDLMEAAKEAEIGMVMSECKDKFQTILSSKMKESESGFLSNVRMKQLLEASSASTLSDFQKRLDDLRYSDSKKAARLVKLLAFEIKTQGDSSAKENAKKKDDFVSKTLGQVEKDVLNLLERATCPGTCSPEEFRSKMNQAITSAVEVIKKAQTDPDVASEMEAQFLSSIKDRLEEFEATVKTAYANGKENLEKFVTTCVNDYVDVLLIALPKDKEVSSESLLEIHEKASVKAHKRFGELVSTFSLKQEMLDAYLQSLNTTIDQEFLKTRDYFQTRYREQEQVVCASLTNLVAEYKVGIETFAKTAQTESSLLAEHRDKLNQLTKDISGLCPGYPSIASRFSRAVTQEIEIFFDTVMEHHQNRETSSQESFHDASAAVADKFRNELTQAIGSQAVKSSADLVVLADKLQGQYLSTVAKDVAKVFTKEKTESFVQVLRSLMADIVVEAKQTLESQINTNADAIKQKISNLSSQHKSQLCELMNSATTMNEDILSFAHREKLEGHLLEFSAFLEKFPLVQDSKYWKEELHQAMRQEFLEVKGRFLEREESVKNICDSIYNQVVSDYTNKMTRVLNQAKYHDEIYVQEQNRNFVLAAMEELDRRSKDSSGLLNATEIEGLRVRIEAKVEKDFQQIFFTLTTKWQTFKSNTRRFRLQHVKEFQMVGESPPASLEDDMDYDNWLGREMEGHLTAFKNQFLAAPSLLGSREMQLFEDDLTKMRMKLFNRFETIGRKAAVTQRYKNLMENEMSKSSNITSSELGRIHTKTLNEMLSCKEAEDLDVDSHTLRSWFNLEFGKIKECMTPVIDTDKTPLHHLPKPGMRSSFTRKPSDQRVGNFGAVQLPATNNAAKNKEAVLQEPHQAQQDPYETEFPNLPQFDMDNVSLCGSISADKENDVTAYVEVIKETQTDPGVPSDMETQFLSSRHRLEKFETNVKNTYANAQESLEKFVTTCVNDYVDVVLIALPKDKEVSSVSLQEIHEKALTKAHKRFGELVSTFSLKQEMLDAYLQSLNTTIDQEFLKTRDFFLKQYREQEQVVRASLTNLVAEYKVGIETFAKTAQTESSLLAEHRDKLNQLTKDISGLCPGYPSIAFHFSRTVTPEIETFFGAVMEHHQNRETSSQESFHVASAGVADKFRNELTQAIGSQAVKSSADLVVLAEKLGGQYLSTAANHFSQSFSKEKTESFVQVLRSLMADIVVEAKQNLESQINTNADAIKQKISNLSSQHKSQLCELMNSATTMNEDILSSAHREKLEGHLEFSAFLEKFPLVQDSKYWKEELHQAMRQEFLEVKGRFLEREESVKNICDSIYNQVVSDYTNEMTRVLNQAKYRDEIYVQEQNRKFMLAAMEELDRRSKDSSGLLNATEIEGLRVRIEAKMEKDFQQIFSTLTTKWQTFKSNTRRFRLQHVKEFQMVGESPPASLEDDMDYDNWLGREMEGHLAAFKNKFLAEPSYLGSREMQFFEDDLMKMRMNLFSSFETIERKSAFTQRYKKLMENEMSKSSNLTMPELERIHKKTSTEMLHCREAVDMGVDLSSWINLEFGKIKECMTPVVDMNKTPQRRPPKPGKRNSFGRKPFHQRAGNIGAVQLPAMTDAAKNKEAALEEQPEAQQDPFETEFPDSPQSDVDSVISICGSVSGDKENDVISGMDNEQAVA